MAISRSEFEQSKPAALDKKTRIALIDMSAIGYACMYQESLARMRTQSGEPTAALHGVPSTLSRLLRLYPNATPVLLWEGKAHWRYRLCPGYKADRLQDAKKQAIRESYQRQSTFLRWILLCCGLPSLGHPQLEADDGGGLVLAALRSGPRTSDWPVALISSDTDWFQGIDDLTHVFNPRQGVTASKSGPRIGLEELRSGQLKEGAFPNASDFIDAKCLTGDDSDCIEGVRDVGMTTVSRWIAEHGSIAAVWEKWDAGQLPKGKRLESACSPEARELYYRNQQLMNWNALRAPEGLAVSSVTPDTKEIQELCKQFELNQAAPFLLSLARDQDRQQLWKEQTLELNLSLKLTYFSDEPQKNEKIERYRG